jgi:hypothetical protein
MLLVEGYKLGTGCKDTLVICNSAFMALYLVQKYEKNAVANGKCVFATCTEFTYFKLYVR